MDPTGVVTVISQLSAVGEKPWLLQTWRKNQLVDGNTVYVHKKEILQPHKQKCPSVYSVNTTGEVADR